MQLLQPLPAQSYGNSALEALLLTARFSRRDLRARRLAPKLVVCAQACNWLLDMQVGGCIRCPLASAVLKKAAVNTTHASIGGLHTNLLLP